MKSNDKNQSENPCFSCGGTGGQTSIYGENYPTEPCCLCHGDKVIFTAPEEDIKRPYLARF